MTAKRNDEWEWCAKHCIGDAVGGSVMFAMIDSWRSCDGSTAARGNLSRGWILGAGLLAAMGLSACGVQGHPQPLPPGIGVMGGAPGNGGGGVSAGTGGKVVGGSGGQPGGSGGITAGPGGAGGGQTG